jgi:hypothetical protein
VAGARPGLQNRGDVDASFKSRKNLRKETTSSAAQGQRAASNDPDLAAVVKAWAKLPEAIKAGILAMVNAASEVQTE